MTRSTSASLLAVLLALAGCAPDAVLPTLDAAPDDAAEDARALEVGADAAPDVQPDAHADAAVTPDAAPPADAAPDASAPDVQGDAPAPDAAVMPDVASTTDVQPDAPADVAVDRAVADAPADVAAPCVDRAVRCTAGAPEFCVGGAWVVGSCGSLAPTGATNTCAMNNCYACRRAASGSGCAAEPLCADDVDCFRMGQGRCVAGLCARMGMIACATAGDCGAWQTSTTRVSCVENRNAVTGGVVMACDNTSRPCVDDAMCPRAYRCDTASGYCRAL